MRYFLNRLRKMLQNWESKKQTKKVKRYISSKICVRSCCGGWPKPPITHNPSTSARRSKQGTMDYRRTSDTRGVRVARRRSLLVVADAARCLASKQRAMQNAMQYVRLYVRRMSKDDQGYNVQIFSRKKSCYVLCVCSIPLSKGTSANN